MGPQISCSLSLHFTMKNAMGQMVDTRLILLRPLSPMNYQNRHRWLGKRFILSYCSLGLLRWMCFIEKQDVEDWILGTERTQKGSLHLEASTS